MENKKNIIGFCANFAGFLLIWLAVFYANTPSVGKISISNGNFWYIMIMIIIARFLFTLSDGKL